jgi:hypothetical protein
LSAVSIVISGDADAEQRDGVRSVQDVDLDPSAQRAPPGGAGGDQNMHGTGGPVAGDIRRVIGVVEISSHRLRAPSSVSTRFTTSAATASAGSPSRPARPRNCSGIRRYE